MFKKRKQDQTASDQNIPVKQKDTKSYYDVAMEWEVSRTHLSAQSERRAWRIAVCLLILLLCSWAGLFLMLPLKRDIPYVVQVDNATGRTEISQVYNPSNLGFNEIRDKYWINRFIQLYESYNFYTLPNDYSDLQLFAEDDVFQSYQRLYAGPNARQKLYRDNLKIDTDIISILIRPSRGNTATASVRFSISRVGVKQNPGAIIDTKIYTAEIIYSYQSLALDEKGRFINPLGFRVTSYQLAADN